MYLVNKSLYLLDLPGYGFARVSGAGRDQIKKLLNWYLFESAYRQKRVILVVDAEVGPTPYDIETLGLLLEHGKHVVIVANKVDKIRSSDYNKKMKIINEFAGSVRVIPYSSTEMIGIKDLSSELFA